MNIVLTKNDFNIENINLLKKRNNTVIEGTFTKFTYSNEYLTMNGIYLQLVLSNMVMKNDGKFTTIIFPPYDKQNIGYIQYITSIELEILDYYNRLNNTNKKHIMVLTQKLYSGNIRSKLSNYSKVNNKITVKISGIWETMNEIGLAIKIIQNVDI
tara:strand:+ start:187 stop:654 length:468 start_codon:yes stop_codon:yes gene_type:complete